MPNRIEEANPLLLDFVQQGVQTAELKEYFMRELVQDGFSSMDINYNCSPITVVLRVLNTHDVIGEQKIRIKQLSYYVASRLNIPESNLQILVEAVENKWLCPHILAEFVKAKILDGMNMRRAVNSALFNAETGGAQGSMVVLSGKIKGQRARSMKFVNGKLIHSGDPRNYFIKEGFSEAHLKQGVIGIKVKIMLPYDPEGIKGISRILPNKITVFDPK